ncbi:Hypothetical protein LUCI_4433 [Lucifera butyrica]|uniref:Uncharacterized protein n=1 Tax=Lucifera butyrica TaxID=1351585 RepID=A0A498RDZ1_9FIRM|nr:hypothetical protein [Lucifera butyrica]VBB09147.1 Hypothetical protein LUCI_4433 [Lucifera butyrica]
MNQQRTGGWEIWYGKAPIPIKVGKLGQVPVFISTEGLQRFQQLRAVVLLGLKAVKSIWI